MSELTPRLITTTGPKLLRVTFALTSFGFKTTGPRVPATRAAVKADSAAARSISRPSFSGEIHGFSLRRKRRASTGFRAKRELTSVTYVRSAGLRTVTVSGTTVFGVETSACCTAFATEGTASDSVGASRTYVPYPTTSGSANCVRTYSVAASGVSPPTGTLPITTPSGIIAAGVGSAARAGAQTRTASATTRIERRFIWCPACWPRGFAGRR